MDKLIRSIIIGIVVLAFVIIVVGVLTGNVGGNNRHCVCNNHNCNCKVYDYNNKLIKSYSYKN